MALPKVGICSDHAGKVLKRMVHDFIKQLEYEVVDYGVGYDTDASVDYPDYASLLAKEILSEKIDLGIAICGTGIGMSIVANKFPGIRASVCADEFSARMTRAHNNSNILCLGARVLNHHRATDLVKIWLETQYEGGRHETRLDKIRAIEKEVCKLDS